MDWGDALAETFLAEAQAFGEDVFFRGGLHKAVVGNSDQIKGLEMGGYLEQQSIQIVLPKASLLGLNRNPSVNEIIEARGKGYRIHSVQLFEETHAYDLTCELIPEYIVQGVEREVLYRQPAEVSNVNASRLASPPTDVHAISNPVAPSQVVVQQTPSVPSNVESDIPYVDLYLVMGQSNAHGHSAISGLTSQQQHNIHVGFHTSWHHNTSNATTTQYYSGYDTNMKIGKTRGDTGETTVDSNNFGVEWGFAKKLEADNNSHDKIGIIKYAVGASTIQDSSFADWDPSKNNECFQGFKNTIADALPKIKASGLEPRWKGFVWYQGESNGGTQPYIYKAWLAELVSAIEAELSVTNLPCVFVAPADQNGNDLYVNNAHASLAKEENYYDFVKASTYHSGANSNVHLDSSDMYDLGEAVGSAMARATSGTATEKEFQMSDITSRLWLDFDDTNVYTMTGANVTQIADKSGNNYSFSASGGSTLQPIANELGGRTILRFDQNADFTNAPPIAFSPTARHRWFFVVKVTSVDAHDALLTYSKSNPTLQLILFNFSGAGQFKAEWYGNPNPQLRGNSTNLLNQWHILSVEYDIPNTRASAFLDATAYNTNVSASGISTMGAGQLRFNKYQNTIDSDWAEAVFLEDASATDVQKVEGYLAHKWSISSLLPSSHPYKYYAP